MSQQQRADHLSELALLAVISLIVGALAGYSLYKGNQGDAAAYIAVLMAIIAVVKDRSTQRSVDRMGASLANSPPAEPPAGEPK